MTRSTIDPTKACTPSPGSSTPSTVELAARLLEAKEAVVDVNAQSPRATLAADLDHLLDAARQGLVRLAVTVGPCP